MQNNINVKSIPVNEISFFRVWMEFLRPFHKLPNKEMDVVAYLLHRRYTLKKEITNDKLVDKLLLDKDARDDIKEKMGYKSNQVLSNMLTGLRTKKILVDNKITSGLIPNMSSDTDNFKLIFNFKINEA